MGLKSKTLKTIALFLLSSPLFSAENNNFFSVEKDGSIKAGNLIFRAVCHDASWKNPTSQKKCVPDTPVPENSENCKISATFNVHGGYFQMHENISHISPNSIRCSYTLKSDKGVAAKQLALQTVIDPNDYSDPYILLDGRKCAFNQKLNEKKWNISFSNISTIEIPLNKGTLLIKGESLSGNLVDRRM